MKYQKIVKAQFIERPNRFVARVTLEGEDISVHVKNTGRCKELLVPGCTVYLEDFTNRMGSRKMAYDLVSVEKLTPKGNLLINMDSQAPNKIAREGFESGVIQIPGLGKLRLIRPETTFENSRVDFYLEDEKGKKCFAEIKGCTLEDDGVCSFPDAPTERGVKHIEELIKAKEQGYVAVLVFIVQMEGMSYLRPNDETHKAFGDALRKAASKGVSVLAYECKVSADEVNVIKALPVKM